MVVGGVRIDKMPIRKDVGVERYWGLVNSQAQEKRGETFPVFHKMLPFFAGKS